MFATREGRVWDGSELQVHWCELEDPLPTSAPCKWDSNTAVTQCRKHFPPCLFYRSPPVENISVALWCVVNLRKIKIYLRDVRALTAFLMGCWTA